MPRILTARSDHRGARPGRHPEPNHIATRDAARSYLLGRWPQATVNALPHVLSDLLNLEEKFSRLATWKEPASLRKGLLEMRDALGGAGIRDPALDGIIARLSFEPPPPLPSVKRARAMLDRGLNGLRFAVEVLDLFLVELVPLPTARELLALAVVCGFEKPVADELGAVRRLEAWKKIRTRALRFQKMLAAGRR